MTLYVVTKGQIIQHDKNDKSFISRLFSLMLQRNSWWWFFQNVERMSKNVLNVVIWILLIGIDNSTGLGTHQLLI